LLAAAAVDVDGYAYPGRTLHAQDGPGTREAFDVDIVRGDLIDDGLEDT
jgi:hypothetical protein